MKRRSFILLTGLGISAIGASAVKLFNLHLPEQAAYVKPKLLSQLCDDETIRGLGHSYLELRPTERNPDVLMKEIYGARVDIDGLRKQDILLVQTQSETAIRRDFALGKTVILNGWILSLTEARQCALYFMLNS